MNEPWKLFNESDTATIPEGPWKLFNGDEQTDEPPPASAAAALAPPVQQVNSLAPAIDMGWTGRPPPTPEQPDASIPRLVNIEPTMIRGDASGQGPQTDSAASQLDIQRSDAGMQPFTPEQATAANERAGTALGESLYNLPRNTWDTMNKVSEVGGNIARAGVADIADTLSRNFQNVFKSHPDIGGEGNLFAYFNREPMPIDKALSMAAQDAVDRGEFPTEAAVGKLSQDLTATAPLILGFGIAPKAVQMAVGAAFTYKMLREAPETFRKLGAEMGKPMEQRDPNLITALVSQGAQEIGFGGLGLLHGITSAKKSITDFTNPEVPSIETQNQARRRSRLISNMEPIQAAEQVRMPNDRQNAFAGKLQQIDSIGEIRKMEDEWSKEIDDPHQQHKLELLADRKIEISKERTRGNALQMFYDEASPEMQRKIDAHLEKLNRNRRLTPEEEKFDKFLEDQIANRTQPVESGSKPAEPVAPPTAPAGLAGDIKSALDVDPTQLAGYRGKNGSSVTGYFWDLGAKAKSAEDVAALRQMALDSKAKVDALRKAGDFEGAMKEAGRQAGEAYEYATGVMLDGKPKWGTFEKYNPDY